MAPMHPAPTYVRPSLLPSKKPPSPPRVELFHVDLATWDDGLWDIPAYTEEQPDELDEPWPYRFKVSATSLGYVYFLCSFTWVERGKCLGVHQ